MDLQTTSVLVGENNAGKSTHVDTFRQVAAVCNRCARCPMQMGLFYRRGAMDRAGGRFLVKREWSKIIHNG